MRRPTVLFVDDEPHITDGVKRALRREPFDIVGAHSGSEALELLCRRAVDVIIVDEKMPGISGTELLQRVFRDYPRVIQMMLTGHAAPETVFSTARPGQIRHFFTKPCSVEELASAIREALDQQHPGATPSASIAR